MAACGATATEETEERVQAMHIFGQDAVQCRRTL